MKRRPIAFFDTGVGGLPYLAVAKRMLPMERFVYLFDRASFPYGRRSRDEVVSLTVKAVRALSERLDPKIVVIACNTATAAALADLRGIFDVPIVGTVAAVKPAAAASIRKRIGIVATRGAVHDPYVDDLVARFAPDCFVARRGDGELVEFVERRFLDSTEAERREAVRPTFEDFSRQGVDAVVLGCTHFVFLSEDFASAFGPSVRIVDSRDGVGSQVARLAEEGQEPETARSPEPDLMYMTGSAPFEDRYRSFAARFGLDPAGSLY